MKEFVFQSVFDPPVTEIIGLGAWRDGWKAQHLEATLFLQIARQVVLMDPLHHQDYAGGRFVIGAGEKRGSVPFDDPRTNGFRHCVAWFDWVVDDDQVAAKTGQRAFD